MKKGYRKVVFCKDCKWYYPYSCLGCDNYDGMRNPDDDDYCSRGEKR